MAESSAAVIGAGVSGSLCAHQLANHGFRVTVFDKGRGPGGRMATRRVPPHAFDHGAQYFTLRDARFGTFVDGWLESGVVAKWSGSLVNIRDGKVAPAGPGERFVGVPGMSAIARELLRACETRFRSTVERVRLEGSGWSLRLSDGSHVGPFDVLLMATPPQQAVTVAQGVTALLDSAHHAAMVPCWATAIAFPARINVPFNGAFIDCNPLAWIARDSSKPGRERGHDTWVLHASGEWSQAHLEHSHDFVSEALLSAFETAIGSIDMTPKTLLTHRWRYARPTRSDGPDSLYDATQRIGFCGDWLTDGRVEAAALSGLELAERVIGREC